MKVKLLKVTRFYEIFRTSLKLDHYAQSGHVLSCNASQTQVTSQTNMIMIMQKVKIEEFLFFKI